jgi:nicotinamide-nucleotide amidase
MNAEIIAVGSELLLGQITNTNGQYISKQLAEIGVNVYFHTVVGDNEQRLTEAIMQAQKRANLIVVTGGLGPTKDDLTKETIATLTDRSLIFDTKALNNLESFFKKRNRTLDEKNKKQALVIEGSTVFENRQGLAPGMAFSQDECLYILLPGPPKELEPMMLVSVKAYLHNLLSKKEIIHSKVLRFFGIGEAQLELELIDLIEQQTNPTIAPLAADGEVTIRLTCKESSKQLADTKIAQLEQRIMDRVGTYFYGYDDSSLIENVKKGLLEKNITIAAAESLTGGLFSEQITSLSGSSAIFCGSIVSYTNFVKEGLLQVKKETLDTYGAVSEQCAKEMAEQIRMLCKSDIGISFTGVAGPTEQENKSVGTVYIGICKENETTEVYTLKLAGSRQQIRYSTIKYGCFHLLKELKRWN